MLPQRFRPEPASVGAARRLVSETVRECSLSAGKPVDDDDLVLLASELATNAILHARTEFSVAVAVLSTDAGPVAHLEVGDGSAALPSRRPFSTSATTGRGLRLLSDLSRDWGARSSAPAAGKTVWADVPLTSGAPGATDRGLQSEWLALLNGSDEDL